ncbi:MAG: ATP-binding cassette domain-containing protein [Litorilinea sp.]
MTAITTQALSKTYIPSQGEPVLALREVDLAIAAGEIYALLGPNGAGKTTLISILTTLLLPSAGRAEIAGYDVVQDPAQVRRRIGVTFQETVLDLQLSGRQVLEFHGRLYGLAPARIQAHIDELSALVELRDALDRKVASYSGGMKRRLELIRGLLTRPEILFLDEPTQGLDPQNRLAIWRYLAALRREYNLTILLTTHYMEEAETLADRVGIIAQGSLILEGPPAQLSAELGQDVIALTGTGDAATYYQRLQQAEWIENVARHAAPGATIAESTLLQIGVSNGAARLAQVVELAAASNFTIHDLSVKRPTLSDVFLAVTGTNLPKE